MRDILTALAGVVILILVAALAVPPFIDWRDQRALVDRAIGRSLALPARTDGRIEVRLLPSPRLRLDRLHLGGGDAGQAELDARFVRAEVALAPLLKGELRFTETQVGRAEVKLPVADGDALLLPPEFAGGLRARDLAIEELRIQQLLVTTFVPATGRTDQFAAESLHVQTPSLAGPWRVDGTSGGMPFRLATGEVRADGGVTVKLSAGGDDRPSLEADARLALVPAAEGAQAQGTAIEGEGSARLVVGPPAQAAGAYLPFSLAGKFKSRGGTLRFEGVNAEIDPGGQPVRLAGTGRVDLRAGRAALALEARRLDLDALLSSAAGQALLAGGAGRPRLPLLLDLDLAAESVGLAREDWSNLSLRATLDRSGGVIVRGLSALAPGAAAIALSGEADLEPALRLAGQISVEAPSLDGFERYLRRLGLAGPPLGPLAAQTFRGSADLSAAPGSLSLRNLRLALGDTRVTGNGAWTRGTGDQRGRVDAQVVAQSFDIAALPSFDGALAALQGQDFGLTIQARDVRYGQQVRSGSGTIAARIQSDGASLVVDSLDVTDLAGANAKLAGAIAPDGSGRVTGRVSAANAAPLAALLDRTWVAEARLVPEVVRAGAIDLDVALERAAGAAEALRTSLRGTMAGGTLDAALVSQGSRLQSVRIESAAPRAGLWLRRTDIPGLDQPASLRIAGTRDGQTPTAPLRVELSGTLAGLRLSTETPLAVSVDAPPAAGRLRGETEDLRPFLALGFDTAALTAPVGANIAVDLAGAGEDTRLALSGTLAGAAVQAALTLSPEGDIAGSAKVARASLPLLAGLALAPSAAPHKLDVTLTAERLDLGRGFEATGATGKLGLVPGSLSLREASGTLAGGHIEGDVVLRQEAVRDARPKGAQAVRSADVSASGRLRGADLAVLAGGGAGLAGRLSADLQVGAAAPSLDALMGSLAGSGSLTLEGLTVKETDPAGVARALARIQEEDDPLRDGRLSALVGEALAAGPARAGGTATAPVTILGGSLRAGPLDLALGAGRWQGTLVLDFRSGQLDARGTLSVPAAAPEGWTGGPPSLQLGLSGPIAAPVRTLDTGSLATGLAALVLQRELERIEALEADQAERQRRRARIEMDKARAAALKAAAERAAAEEAQRQARQRAQQAAEEAIRGGGAAPAAGASPLDIRPQPQP